MRIGGRRPEEARVFDSDAGYHRFHTESGEEYGSFEVFWRDYQADFEDDLTEEVEAGWYWWACFPGCMPDGDAVGPFGSSTAAMLDADEYLPDNMESEDE